MAGPIAILGYNGHFNCSSKRIRKNEVLSWHDKGESKRRNHLKVQLEGHEVDVEAHQDVELIRRS